MSNVEPPPPPPKEVTRRLEGQAEAPLELAEPKRSLGSGPELGKLNSAV